MKKYILITLLSLFSVALLAQTPEEKAEQISYKHDRNTIFAVKENNKFHAFNYEDEITYLGYVVFNGSSQSAATPAALDDETSKHMSESYFFLVVDNTYQLYYKTYMGEAKLITVGEKLITKGSGMKAMATSMATKKKSEESEAEPAAEPESKPAADEGEDDDDGGGVSWWIWLIAGWFLIRMVID